MDQATFEDMLDEYQATMYEEASQASQRSYETAARPGAIPQEVTFSELISGDYMTNEGPDGRWVKVIELRGPSSYVRSKQEAVAEGTVSVLMEIPEAVTVSGETRYWIDRPPNEPVTIDLTARA